MKDDKKFKSYMAMMGEIFDKEVTKALSGAYWQILTRFTDEQCISAFDRAISTCKFFPRPAELIEFINGSPQEMADKGQIEACKVLNAIKRIGGYEGVQFDDPVTVAVIEEGFGGWVRLCTDQREKDEKWFIKDFTNMYASFKRQGRKSIKHLPGRCETENFANGRLGREDEDGNLISFIPEPKVVSGGDLVKRISENDE